MKNDDFEIEVPPGGIAIVSITNPLRAFRHELMHSMGLQTVRPPEIRDNRIVYIGDTLHQINKSP